MFIRINRVTKDIEVVFNAQVAATLRLESAEILFNELGAAIEEVEAGEEPTKPAVELEPEPVVEPELVVELEPEPVVEPEPEHTGEPEPEV